MPSIKYILVFKSKRGKNNFYKHVENNDAAKIKAMFKRGTVKKVAI